VQAISWGAVAAAAHVYQLDSQGTAAASVVTSPAAVGRPNTGQALDNLLRMPEPGVSKNEWVRKLFVDKMVYGNALVTQDRRRASACRPRCGMCRGGRSS
jgi:phage portal protein BeeE